MSIDPNNLYPQEGTHADLNELFGDPADEGQTLHSGVHHDEYPVQSFNTSLDEAVSRELVDTEAPDAVHVEGDEITPIKDLSPTSTLSLVNPPAGFGTFNSL